MNRLADVVGWAVGVAAMAALLMLFTLEGGAQRDDVSDDAGEARTEPASEPAEPVADLVLGETVYAARCASCHGSGGEGGVGPALDEGRMIERYPEPDEQRQLVVDGRLAMPAFGPVLSDAELDAVVAFTRDGWD